MTKLTARQVEALEKCLRYSDGIAAIWDSESLSSLGLVKLIGVESWSPSYGITLFCQITDAGRAAFTEGK